MNPIKQKKQHISSEDRKEQIIDTALTIFADKGFSGTRTREIAEAAGISETLIFRHFPTKEDLILTSLTSLFHSQLSVKDVHDEIKNLDAKGFFTTIAMHLIRHNLEEPRILKLVLHSSLERKIFGELIPDDTGHPMLTLISSFIQQKIDEGYFLNTNPDITARLFVETVFMYIADKALAISGPPLPYSDDDVVEVLVDLYLKGMMK